MSVSSSTGEVVRFTRSDERVIVAPSFIEYIETYLTRLESGQFHFVPTSTRLGIGTLNITHASSSSYSTLCMRICVLYDVDRFALNDACGSITVTRSIRIEVSVVYVPDVSDAHSNMFAYSIRVTHTGVTNKTTSLTTHTPLCL